MTAEMIATKVRTADLGGCKIKTAEATTVVLTEAMTTAVVTIEATIVVVVTEAMIVAVIEATIVVTTEEAIVVTTEEATAVGAKTVARTADSQTKTPDSQTKTAGENLEGMVDGPIKILGHKHPRRRVQLWRGISAWKQHSLLRKL